MVRDKGDFLLKKYFHYGWLNRCYYDGKGYTQPYSAEERLLAGELFYGDYLCWRKGVKLISNYQGVKVDTSVLGASFLSFNMASERFRRALKCVSKTFLNVVYEIVLNEEEIKSPKTLSARERLYFNDEIKGLLCRGLDELCRFYAFEKRE